MKMKKQEVIKLFGFFLLLFFIDGCVSLNETFIRAVREHRQDTELVSNSLIDSIEEEMSSETRPEAIAAYREIISNLHTISHQARILDNYVWRNITEDKLAEFLKNNWRTNP